MSKPLINWPLQRSRTAVLLYPSFKELFNVYR
jgi:hypothetical protein